MENPQILPESTYRQRCEAFGVQRDQQERRSRRNGDLNLLLFGCAFVGVGVALWRAETVFYALAAILVVAFVAGLIQHGRVKRALLRFATLFTLNDEGLRRLRRDWAALPLPHPAPDAEVPPAKAGAATTPIDRSTVADLDLLGHAGLEQLLSTPNTPIGQRTLREWIMQPAAPDAVRLRQAAVAELAPLIDFRDEIGLRGRLMTSTQSDYERFIAWAESAPWLHRRVWLIWVARWLPLVALALGIAELSGQPVMPALIGVLLVNFALTMTLGRTVADHIAQVASRQGVFDAYAALFQRITAQPFVAPELRRLQSQLGARGVSADRQMVRLERLMPLADIRRSIFFYPVEVAALWSFHLLWLLEGWQRDAGGNVRGWLAALGEIEALIALATLHHDHPAWVFPGLVNGEIPVLTAKALAHPLLPPGKAVGNDVTLGPPGSYLLVTGSNMSGKSTLLRAIGVNAVLAQMGGPVCATHMQLPSVIVAASMRVQDSLEQGVSFFMAELRRLKAIVDLADQRRATPVLYLLDEILQGTNTGERQIAARRIILHLVKSGALGAVSTHDLTLAEASALAAASVPVYFTETFTRGAAGPAMSFDYHLRAGIATSTNALKLMELVGLPLDDELT